MKISSATVNAHTVAVLFVAALATACSGGDGKGGSGGTSAGGGGSGATGGGGSGATGGGGAGTGGSSSFTPATPPSDVCALLTLADVQAILPGALPGEEQPTGDNTDLGFWARDCKYTGNPSNYVSSLVVFGALKESALPGIIAAQQSGDVNTPVGGLGDEARYWEDNAVAPVNGVWARKGSYFVDITNSRPAATLPTADQMKPLISKTLDQLL